jgi:chromosome segregation ATPase
VEVHAQDNLAIEHESGRIENPRKDAFLKDVLVAEKDLGIILKKISEAHKTHALITKEIEEARKELAEVRKMKEPNILALRKQEEELRNEIEKHEIILFKKILEAEEMQIRAGEDVKRHRDILLPLQEQAREYRKEIDFFINEKRIWEQRVKETKDNYEALREETLDMAEVVQEIKDLKQKRSVLIAERKMLEGGLAELHEQHLETRKFKEAQDEREKFLDARENILKDTEIFMKEDVEEFIDNIQTNGIQ